MADRIDALFKEHWDRHHDEAKEKNPQFEDEDYYKSGRASKANPNKEDPKWWAENGPLFVKAWEKWKAESGFTLWEFPDEETGELRPGIEVKVMAHRPGPLRDGSQDLFVRSYIDRVFVNSEGELLIVDLKTGSMVQPWPLQLALNNLGMVSTFGEQARVRWAGFWSARTGEIKPNWFDLSIYDDEWLWEQVWTAKQIRDQQLFLASPNNFCNSACGVRAYCPAVGGKAFVPLGKTRKESK